MGLLDGLVRSQPQRVEQRMSWNDYLMSFAGNRYQLNGLSGSKPDVPNDTFTSYIESVHRKNGVVSAAVETRALLLSQLRFAWRSTGRTDFGRLFGTRELRWLENPGSDTRPAFLHRLEVDASYAGSAYVVKTESGLKRLRPDRCSVVLESDSDPSWNADGDVRLPYDAEITGLVYNPSVSAFDKSPVQVFPVGKFAIWSPEPDPINFWRGMSWVTSVMREVLSDGQATDHQSKFFENAATPNLVFLMDPSRSPDETRAFADLTNRLHAGAGNAYRNMFLGGGTDVKVVGSTLESLNMKDLTGGFENRVSVRSRVPAVILGVRESLSGSSLNAGNYNSARRMLADGWLAPTAESLCSALESLMDVPAGAELHYDRNKILFLQEDAAQQADIMSTKTAAMRTLIDGGYTPESVTQAISDDDLTKLVHSGNVSVQLQPPGVAGTTPTGDAPSRDVDVVGLVRDVFGAVPASPSSTVNVHVTREDVTVSPAEVTVLPAEITVLPAEVRVDAPVTVHPADVRMDAPQVVVNVEPTPIRNEVNVSSAPATVTVLPADDVPSKFRVRRDNQGRISEVVEGD